MSTHYQAFLLRLQRGQGQSHWRVTLVNANTGKEIQFGNEREMFRYLAEFLKMSNENVGDSDLALFHKKGPRASSPEA